MLEALDYTSAKREWCQVPWQIAVVVLQYLRLAEVDQVFVCGVRVQASYIQVGAAELFPRLALVAGLATGGIRTGRRHAARCISLKNTKNTTIVV